jgi:hypothetical protein
VVSGRNDGYGREISGARQRGGAVVSGFNRMAAFDTASRIGLSTHRRFSERRDVRSHKPDSTFSGIGAKQYCGRAGKAESTGEFRQFPGIARGSNFELQTQLEIARTLKFGNSEQINEAEGLSHEVGKMIHTILEKTDH